MRKKDAIRFVLSAGLVAGLILPAAGLAAPVQTPYGSSPSGLTRVAVADSKFGRIGLAAGESLVLDLPSGSLTLAEAGLFGSPAAAVAGHRALLGWSEVEVDGGRGLAAELVDIRRGRTIRRVELASPEAHAGDLLHPGLALASNGKEFGALYLRSDRGEVVFQSLALNGRLKGEPVVLDAKGTATWVRLIALGSDFVAGWIDQDLERGTAIRISRIDSNGSVTSHVLRHPSGVGAFDMVADEERLTVVHDTKVSTVLSQVGLHLDWVTGSVESFVVANNPFEGSFDPALVRRGDVIHVLSGWYHDDQVGVVLRALTAAGAEERMRLDLSPAKSVVSTDLLRTPDGLWLSWAAEDDPSIDGRRLAGGIGWSRRADGPEGPGPLER